jgi:Glycoside-hydrolase family GH114
MNRGARRIISAAVVAIALASLLAPIGPASAAPGVGPAASVSEAAAAARPPTPCPRCPEPAPCVGCWQPGLQERWQYQLQAKPGLADASGGIVVDICEPPAAGGPCVTPTVFDIDLYVDQKVSGDGNFVVNEAAVDAIHDAGGHAICYLDAGDAETYRPDYHRFVAFDRACDGCLIGNPFSAVFPDEFFLNVDNDRGQRTFVLKVNRARVRKCAAAGFDGVEWDIIDTFEDPHSGFHISARSQLMFNTRLANMAHRHGLSVAMKNDPSQVRELLPYFDYAVVEECVQWHFCAGNPAPGEVAFVDAGKPVFEVEYRLTRAEFCHRAIVLGFNAIKKSPNYSLFATPYHPCR